MKEDIALPWDRRNGMKNQYFGDINDYKKYGLIRRLSDFGKIPTAVCWMLTPNDVRPDGHRIQYLLEPERWRRFDPVLYDHLREQVIERKKRAVNSLENSNILTKCRFYSDPVQDHPAQRRAYLQRFLEFARDSALVFFDPDNGMEVKSTLFGRKNSSKYLYWMEVEETYSAGHSLLVYQHLPPRPRRQLVRDLANRSGAVTGVTQLYLYWTQFVVFFLIAQSSHEALFRKVNKKITETWGKQIEVEVYRVD